MESPSKTSTICILAAGSGTRMGRYGSMTHKALLPIAESAAISHLIEKFLALIGPKARFVIAVGFHATDVIDYVELAHPDILVEFMRVDDFDAPGAGPGASVLACKKLLRTPFYLTCCDALWTEIHITPFLWNRDWLAVARVETKVTVDYCNVRIAGSEVLSFYDKEKVAGNEFRTFTGLAHIAHPASFFHSLKGAQLHSASLELASGFSGLLSPHGAGLFICEMTGWQDIGTLERYEEVRRLYGGAGFLKFGELFYRVNDQVIKFFADPSVVSMRVARAEILDPLTPAVLQARRHFFSYRYLPGQTLYEAISPGRLENFLHWLEKNLWHPVEVCAQEKQQRGLEFYRDKTLGRMDSYFEDKKCLVDAPIKIQIKTLLAKVPWERLSQVRPVLFHGDLQLDNIIHHPPTGQYSLIDWRQDFAGSLTWGDLYYDCAKLLCSIEIDFRRIQRADGSIFGTACPIPNAEILRNVLKNFFLKKRLEPARIDLLMALICLNMAGIQTAPSNRILFEEGYLRLQRCLEASARPGIKRGLSGDNMESVE